MKRRPTKSISELFAEGTAIDRAMARAAREARRRHKLLGHPIVVWENGRVVHIPPEAIVVDPPSALRAARRRRARARTKCAGG